MVVTFYSFKGGVGRSMAMANVAELLAASGYSVIACDWDLEAPGLERLFAETKAASDDLAARPGLMDLLRGYRETLAGAVSPPLNPETHVRIGDVWLVRPSTYTIRVSNPPSGGSIRLLTAGARPSDEYQNYAEAVRSFDWADFYEKWAGGSYIDFIRQELAAGIPMNSDRILPPAADILLVDSRTGVTEHGGVCTHHLADMVVLMSAANDSNFYGSLRIAKSLHSPALEDMRSGRPVQVLPIRTRVDRGSQVVEVNEFRSRFEEQFSQFLPGGLTSRDTFFDATEIPYIGLYSFGEANLARAGTSREPSLYRAYESITAAIIECGVESGLLREPVTPEETARKTPNRPEAPKPVPGTFELIASADAEPVASDVVAQLQAGAARVVRTLPNGQLSEMTTEDSVGAILLVAPQSPEPWVRAHFDRLLKRWATLRAFRVIVALAPGVRVTAFPYVQRARVVRLTTRQGTLRASQLLRELSGPAPAVAFEPPSSCPYPGGRALDETEARLCFGRNAEVQSIAERAQASRPVLIGGPVGAGKRSFVQAALLPALKCGAVLPDIGVGPVLHLAADEDPVEAVPRALAAAFPVRYGGRASASRVTLTADFIGQLVREQVAEGRRLVCCVYSLERLFTGGERASARSLMVDLVRQAISHPSVLFIGTCAPPVMAGGHPVLVDLRARAVSLELAPLAGKALEAAITGPASLAGLTFAEPSLPTRLAEQATLNRVPTAILQELLRTLWRGRIGETLKEPAGGAANALSSTAAETAELRMSELSEGERKAAERLLATLALDDSGGDSGISLRRAFRVAGGGKTGALVITKLAQTPVLVEVWNNRIRFAGPPLAKHWESLRTWIETERKIRHERAWRKMAIASAAVIAIVMGVAYRQQAQERRLVSDVVARYAQAERSRDPLLALGLAIRAARGGETEETRLALESALAEPIPAAILTHDATITEAAFSTDSATVGIADADGSVRIWSVADGRLVASIKLGARIRALAFSPNRQTFATGDDHGTVALWNADTRSPVWRSEHKQPVVIVEFAPDGEQLVAGGLDGGVWLLAAGDGKAQSWQGHVAAITSATFSPDRQRILTTSIDGSARVWLVATGVEVGIAVSPTTGVPLTSGAFLPDGTGFLVVGPAGAFKVAKNNRTSRVPGTGEGDMGNTPSFAVSPNGRSVAIGIADRIDVVDLTTGNTRPLRRRAAAVGQEIPAAATDLEFDRTGSVLLAAYDDGAAVIWDVELQQERAVFRVRRERLRFAKFSPDGRLVLTAGDALDAALWNVVQPSIPPNSPFDFLRQRATEAIPRNLTLADISPDRMRPR